jgi:NADPH:quinone reductase
MKTKQIVLASRPDGMPSAGNFRLEDCEVNEPNEGEVLLQAIYFSVDPYMRGRMSEAKSYMPPFAIDKPLEGSAIAKVIVSKSHDFAAGDIVIGRLPWRMQAVTASKNLQKIDDSYVPASYYLGIMGMPGMTAYFGMTEIGKPKEGETVVVSAAAGAVGLIVGQIAKIKGCRVIGIAGTDEKVNMLVNEYSFDGAINYKTTTDLPKSIAALAPSGADIYYDNTGGEISDAVMQNLNFKARVIVCGQISLYNSTAAPVGPRLQPIMLAKSALMQGFSSSNYQERFPEGLKQMAQWLKEGKLKYTETVLHGFDRLPAAMTGLFKGRNKGKMIVEI